MENNKPVAWITIGCQGSGKSTWAKEYCIQNNAVRINNDEIRNAIYERLEHRNWSKQIEAIVKKHRSARIALASHEGQDIIIDNTHCNLNSLQLIVNECVMAGFNCTLVSFLDVDVEECIRRDSRREGYERVGELVIRRTYESSKLVQKWLSENSSKFTIIKMPS